MTGRPWQHSRHLKISGLQTLTQNGCDKYTETYKWCFHFNWFYKISLGEVETCHWVLNVSILASVYSKNVESPTQPKTGWVVQGKWIYDGLKYTRGRMGPLRVPQAKQKRWLFTELSETLLMNLEKQKDSIFYFGTNALFSYVHGPISCVFL